MTWLTRVPISALQGTGRRMDVAALHRSVMGLFAALPEVDGNRREELGILWRKEPTEYILVRSKVAPTNLPISAKTLQEPEFSISPGDQVLLRVSVNAIRRHSKATGGHLPVNDVEDWLAEKLAPGLCDLVAFRHDRKVYTSEIRDVTVQTDLLDGAATVADSVCLQGYLEKGVGRAKAFGCGLLTIVRR